MKQILRRRADDERGFTIVEVTLTLLILSIVMMLAFDFLDRASILTMRAQANAQTEQDAQLAMRTVTEHLRGASPIGDPCTTATDTPTTQAPGTLPTSYTDCVQFTVRRTTTGMDTCAKTDFVFAIVGTGDKRKLIENRRETTGTGTTAATCTTGPWRNRRILLDKVANSAGVHPLFVYFDGNGQAISPTDTAAIKRAASVRITLAVRFNAKANRSVFTSSAALRNNVSR